LAFRLTEGIKVNTQVASGVHERTTHRTRQARAIALLGPLTVVGGVCWAIVQPYRLTLLHPYHQGFWWLAVEPPLLVAAAGLIFSFAIARPLIADLEGDDGAAR
jgi:hypothetical protein